LSKNPKPISGPSPLTVLLKGTTTYSAGGIPKIHSTQTTQPSSVHQISNHKPLLKSQQENYYLERFTILSRFKEHPPSLRKNLFYPRLKQQFHKVPVSQWISHQQQQHYLLSDPPAQLWPHHLHRLMSPQAAQGKEELLRTLMLLPTQGMGPSKDIPLSPLKGIERKAEAS